MAQYEYAIGAEHDNPALDNIEDIINHAPMAQPLKRGSVRRRTLNRAVQNNGTVSAEWTWGAITRDDFDTLLTYLGSDLTVGSAEVTICTRNPLGRFSVYNATMINPESGDDWERAIGGYDAAEPLTIEFIIHGVADGYVELLDENGFPLLDENGQNIYED